MSKYELRIDRLEFDTEKEYPNIQAFSIGHESCILKFFKIIQQENLISFLNKQKKAGKQIRIITPFIPERHLNEIKEALLEIFKEYCFQDSVVIVNDFGLIRYINRIEPNRNICLGRNLIFSFDYTPWGYKIFESEEPEIQKIVSQVNFYDDEKMDFFKKYNISEIEVNLTKGTLESLKKIRSNGFKVNVHKDNFLYGIQRSCYIRRNSDDNTCSYTECEQIQKIELDELWEATGYYKKTEDFLFPDTLYLYGNQICGEPYDISADFSDSIILKAL